MQCVFLLYLSHSARNCVRIPLDSIKIYCRHDVSSFASRWVSSLLRSFPLSPLRFLPLSLSLVLSLSPRLSFTPSLFHRLFVLSLYFVFSLFFNSEYSSIFRSSRYLCSSGLTLFIVIRLSHFQLYNTGEKFFAIFSRKTPAHNISPYLSVLFSILNLSP